MSLLTRPIISPSLLSADFSRLGEELAALEDAGLTWVHWDVMDGQFVPNITLGAPIIRACRSRSKLFFDVHLMVKGPERFLDDFIQAGADLICVHAEACLHLEAAISHIKAAGKKAGLALNPHTPLQALDYILPSLDLVLVMSVNPGFGGQKFIPFSLQKIARLKELLKSTESSALIEVDGGVNLANKDQILSAGANVLVSGSAFFKITPYTQALTAFLAT